MKKRLFLIIGPAGSGKSVVLRYITTQLCSNAGVVPKLTTRSPLITDIPRSPPELLFISEQDFNNINPDYQYAYGDVHYGVTRHTIQARLLAYSLCALVVGRAELIRRIVADFPEVEVIPLYVLCDLSDRKAHLEAVHLSAQDIAKKLNRDHDPVTEYFNCKQLYCGTILNDGTMDVFLKRIAEAVAPYLLSTERHANIS